MDWYNQSFGATLFVMIVFVMIFMIHTFWIFMLQMNRITNSISHISDVIHNFTEGNLETRITLRNDNELGKLASDINYMAETISQSIEREKNWNQDRYNMITNMSHDLKTPIMSIGGYVEFISQGKYENEQELKLYCDIVSQKTMELNTTINQLFEVSKISSYDFKLQKVTINMKQFTEQVLISFTPQFQEKDMEYRLNIEPDLMLDADPALLKRVFENLVNNTLKYAYNGKYLDINGKMNNGVLELEFENYGDKIEQQELENIFHKFYREKKNSGNEGSGCGLFIAKQIIELHGGTITLQSDERHTVFYIRINLK
jgi:signal transduction histidine kinase